MSPFLVETFYILFPLFLNIFYFILILLTRKLHITFTFLFQLTNFHRLLFINLA